jgi:CRISPR-associated endonuclease Cas1
MATNSKSNADIAAPWQFANAMQIFRLRVMLRATKEISTLPPYHGAVLYATLAAANGRATGDEPAIPDGLLLDAPEQLITSLDPDDRYAFGFTLLAPSREQAARRCHELARGLRLVGRKSPARGVVLGGNFQLDKIDDLVAASALDLKSQHSIEPIPLRTIEAECAALEAHETITLRFLSPLRAHRPKDARSPGQTYFSRDYFNPDAFVSRILLRLHSLGIIAPASDIAPSQALDGHLELLRNELVWLDLKYGYRGDNQSLDGALGRVTLRVPSRTVRDLLVWGQYTRIGESTRFGHGRYRIEQLGLEPFPCRRSRGLLELAFQGAALDRAAEQYEMPSGVTSQAAATLLSGQYTPDAHARVTIESSGGRSRELSIPSRLDRALQRAVLDQIGGPLDSLLEDSSFAYRPGLNRDRAAARIRHAWRKGYRWAVRADVMRFFDTVSHGELEARLAAFLGDDQLVAAIMSWVRTGAPSTGQGLPTGASISPLLANLLLDQFDEEIQRSGGYLVRYSDDFLILFRERAGADEIFAQATSAAQRLQLELNADKSQLVDLTQPFEYLGFRFERHDNWQFTEPHAPCALDDLGWHQAPREQAKGRDRWRLPGETDVVSADSRATVIVGPGCRDVHVEFNELRAYYNDNRPFSRVPIDQVRDLIVLGPANLSGRAIDELSERGCHVLLASDSGHLRSVLMAETPLEGAESITRQVQAASDGSRRLAIARALVVAKLRNYATLAATAPRGKDCPNPAPRITELVVNAEAADSIESLLGFEGAAAAAWYGNLGGYLHRDFRFDRRVAPRATDPTNVLLNIGFTFLYRYLMLMIRQVGLSPAIGFLHVSRAGHATLASDLQEPFRHLIDRAVIQATHELRPRDFQAVNQGPYKLRILPQAARQFQLILHQGLRQACVAKEETEARAYCWHWLATARSLKRHLKEETAFRPFEHP